MNPALNVSDLFEPLDLSSGLRLNGRLVMAPMPTFAAAADGSASDAEVSYYRRRAQSGLAAVVTAGCAVAPDALAFPGQWRTDSDRFLPSLARVARAVRDAGSEPVLQLAHAGDDPDDSRVADAFEAAARRAAEAGCPAVEIHGGHNELLQRRLAQGRPEICLEVVRRIAGRGLSVWYRVDPETRDGLDFDAVLDFAAEAAPHLDVLDLSARRYAAGSLHDPHDPRPRAQLAAQFAAERVPGLAVMAVGGIETPAAALRARSDGCALVGLGHVLLAQPDFPRALREGSWSPPADRPSSDTLRAAQVPEPVVHYLVERSLAR